MPVEEWDDQQGSAGEIDLIRLGGHIWDRRWFIGKVIGVFLIIGVLISLLSRTEYESTSTVLLEEEDSQGQVNQLMQQFGVGSTTSQNSEVFPTALYPEVINTLPFQLNLIGKEITFSEPDTVVNAYTYFNTIYEPSAFELIYDYTIGLPWKIKSMILGGNKEEPLGYYSSSQSFEQPLNEIYEVGGDTLKPIGELKDRIMVTSSGGKLEVVVEMPDPVAAASVGQKTLELLKEYIKGYKTKKAKEDLRYAQEQLSGAREEFEVAQKVLAEFKDRNVNLATAMAQTQEQQLQSEYELAFNVYNSLATKVEDLKLKVQEETPAFTVIHPFEIPRSPSQPNTILIIFISIFLGIFIGIAVAIGSIILSYFQKGEEIQ